MTEKENKINNLITAIVGKVASLISTHNSDNNSHSDIRNAINNISTSGPVTVEKQDEAESGYVATYVIKQNGNQVGSKINIPKDFLVKSGTVETCVFLNQPVGCNVGDKYIDLVINTKANPETDEHIYIKVTDLIDTYEGDDAGTITITNNKIGLSTSIKNTINGKVNKSQGSTNANKNVVTDASGNIITEAKPTIPTKTSDLTNDSNYTTATEHNHDGTYIKTGTGTVTSTNIADKTIVAGDIADTTITGSKLANSTVTATQLASNAVETAKIKDANVTTAKIADSAVTSAKIADKTIVNGDIADNAAIAYSKLSGVAASTHSHSYLPLSGGTLTGGVLHPVTRIGTTDAQHDNLVWAGAFNVDTDLMTTVKANKSMLGTTSFGSNWWSVISVRHRNGSGDGNAWGMILKAPLTTNTSEANANLTWQRDLNGNTSTEKTIIDTNNMVQHKVVNNVLSRATNNQSTAGYFKILTIAISGNYIDSPIQFTINRRLIPTTNVQFYVTYYQKDTSSSSNPRYYKLNQCYYDGQTFGIYVKQTVDNAGAGTFDIYTTAEAWSDLSVTPITTNNLRNTPANVTITPKNEFVTSLPSGCTQATRNPNYVAGDDSRLTNARTPTSHTDSNGAYGKATTSVWGHTKLNSATNSTDETTAATPKAVKAAYDLANGKAPTSHTHGSIANGGTLNSDITSVNKVAVTDSSNNLKTIAKVPFANLNITKANITGLGIPGSDTNTTYSAGTGLNLSSTTFSVKYGTAEGTACQGNDSRLSNARTPTFNHIDASSSVAKDLNNYKTGGFYYTQSNTGDVPYVANRPDNRKFAFFLLVETWGQSSDKWVKQTLTYYDTNVTYVRTCNNGALGSWKALIREGDSRLSDARTPTSHTHGSIANGGTLNSDITSVNKVVVTDSSNNIKTISKLPASAVTHQSITGKADKSSIPNLAFHTGNTLGTGVVASPHAMTHSKNGYIYMSCTDQNGNAMSGNLVISWNNGASVYSRTLSGGMASLQVTNTGTYNIQVWYHNNGKFSASMMGRTTVS